MLFWPPSGVTAQFAFTKFYDLHDGLAPGWVNSISQDYTGNLWLCNRHGLSKFDGRNFVSYYANAGDSTSLQAAEIFNMAHQTNGDAWIATSRGLSQYHLSSNTFTTYTSTDGLTLDLVREVLIENDSILWTGHWWGLDRIHIPTMQVKNYRPYLSQQDSALLHRSQNHAAALKRSLYTGEIYSAHFTSLFRYDAKGNNLIDAMPTSFKNQFFISDFDWLNDSIMIIGLIGKNYFVELNIHTNTTRNVYLPGVQDIGKIAQISEGHIVLVDRQSGIIDYPNKQNMITLPGEIAQGQHAIYLSFLQDNAGRRWIGTQSGLALYRENGIRLFQNNNEIDIYYSGFDASTGVCVTSGYDGSMAWILRKESCTPMDYSFADISPWLIEFSAYQELFYSIENRRLISFHPQTSFRQDYTLSSPINSGVISSVTADASGFLVSHDRQLLRITYSGEIDTLFEHTERIFDFIYRDEELFFSTLGTVQRRDQMGKIHTLYNENKLVPPRDLMLSGDTALWFVQTHTGLVKIDLSSPNNKHTIYGQEKGVISQVFHSMVQHHDQLLISAGFCMLTFDLHKEQVTEQLIHSDGPNHTEFVGQIHVLDDKYYFVTDRHGILIFPYTQLQDTVCGIRMQYLQTGRGSRQYDASKPLVLSYQDNDIGIHLETCYFGEDRDLLYAYKMKLNDPWIEVGGSPLLNFTNLSPGQYSIYARVSKTDGQVVLLSNPVVLHVLPPWWQTWWFRLILVAFVSGSIYLYYQNRISQLKEKHTIEKKLLRLEQIALKSQMNPHFLFNCLNGIRTLIKLKEEDQAVDYVNHLSTLLRHTLLHHEDALIPLKKELAMTENYLTLGKLRFGDKISWTLAINPTIDTDKILVPPFVLQPLVENAMWHGIKHLDTPGEINMIVEEQSDQIVIQILDNGIGLQKSSEQQSNQLRTRKHIGLSLVRKRLEAIHGRFTIQERSDTKGVASIIYLNKTNHV